MFKSNASHGLVWLWLSLVIVLLDLYTKFLAVTHLLYKGSVAVMPQFNLTLAYNEGAAFSLLSSAAGWQRWFLSVVAIAVSVFIIVWLKNAPRTFTTQKLALALILGGAIGNLIDRIRLGYVVDFLDFYVGQWHFPAFNIADMAITTGAVLLLLTLWQKEEGTE